MKEKGYPLHPTGLRNVVPAIRELVRLPPEEWAGALQREPGKGLGMIGAGAGEVGGTILMEKATPVFAKGDALSSHAALVHLDRFGYCLHALFHRHPGQGKEASRPSYIDLETQERLERGKYPVIGAIFTRDGWVRFFSVHNPFQVITYGERLERDEGNLLRLTHLSEG